MSEHPWWDWDTEDDDSWLSEFGGEDVRALVRERNRLLIVAREGEARDPDIPASPECKCIECLRWAYMRDAV